MNPPVRVALPEHLNSMISTFNNLINNELRIKQQRLVPTSTKNRNISTDLLQNGGLKTSTQSITNGTRLTFTSTIVSSISSVNRLGSLPYQVCFFLTSQAQNNLIPFGSAVTASQWVVTGPMSMPEFSPGGSDGNNLVYKTAITNNTGSTQSIIFAADIRVLQALGRASDFTHTITVA